MMLPYFEKFPFGREGNKKFTSAGRDGNIDVDIVLGMPSKNCQFHGICKINASSNLEPDDFMNSKTYLKNSLKAILNLDEKKNLIIRFDCNTITTFIKDKYLKDDLFIISESIKIPDFASSYFRTSFEIKKGIYPIEKGVEYYQIKINP